MWLEGAIRNEWSISQMRGKRWETLGTPPEERQAETDAEQLDVEFDPPGSSEPDNTQASKVSVDPTKLATVQPSFTEVSSPETLKTDSSSESSTKTSSPTTVQSSNRVKLPVDVEELPDDLAEAFESFKLAIIAHRREGWSETSPKVVVECLDALRELAEAQ